MRRLAAVALILGLAVVSVAVALSGGSTSRQPRSPSPSPGLASPSARSASRSVTFTGPRYDAQLVATPTRDPTQHRVWFHDDTWWTVLLSPAEAGSTVRADQRIFRLDPGSKRWIDTGTVVDDRPIAHMDVMALGEDVYIASAGWGKGLPNAARLYTFSYDGRARRYSIAVDSPVRLTTTGMRSLVLSRDSSNRLWIAGIADGKVLVAHSTSTFAVWTPPVAPGATALRTLADQTAIASVGNDVEVTWTSPDSGLFVSRHAVDQPDGSWTDVPIQLEGTASFGADLDAIAAPGPSGERLLVTVGVKNAPGTATSASADIIVVSVEADGSSRPHLLSRISDREAHPQLMVGADGTNLYALVTAPNDDHGTGIYLKQSPIDPISFPTGRGAPLVAMQGEAGIDFGTSSAQAVSEDAGLVAVATDPTGQYATGFIALGTAFPSPSPAPAAAAVQTLVHDTFEAWPRGASLGSTWAVATHGDGTLSVGRDKSGSFARLTTGRDGSRTRACRSVIPTDQGTVRFEVRLKLAAFGTSAGALAIRSGGKEVADVRFDDRGMLGYFDGARLVNTTVAYQPATWYRSVLVADTKSHTFDWQLEKADGTRLLGVRGLAWRVPDPGPLTAVCIEAPAGKTGLALDFDDALVQH